jgi:hypothetical protein
MDIALSLRQAFIKGYFDDPVWDIYLSMIPGDKIGIWFTSVPLELYSKAYDALFDPKGLSCWESFLQACSSGVVKREFVRTIISRSLQTENSRTAALLLKTVVRLGGPYKSLMMDLNAEIRAFCLDWLHLPEAQQVYQSCLY